MLLAVAQAMHDGYCRRKFVGFAFKEDANADQMMEITDDPRSKLPCAICAWDTGQRVRKTPNSGRILICLTCGLSCCQSCSNQGGHLCLTATRPRRGPRQRINARVPIIEDMMILGLNDEVTVEDIAHEISRYIPVHAVLLIKANTFMAVKKGASTQVATGNSDEGEEYYYSMNNLEDLASYFNEEMATLLAELPKTFFVRGTFAVVWLQNEKKTGLIIQFLRNAAKHNEYSHDAQRNPIQNIFGGCSIIGANGDGQALLLKARRIIELGQPATSGSSNASSSAAGSAIVQSNLQLGPWHSASFINVGCRAAKLLLCKDSRLARFQQSRVWAMHVGHDVMAPDFGDQDVPIWEPVFGLGVLPIIENDNTRVYVVRPNDQPVRTDPAGRPIIIFRVVVRSEKSGQVTFRMPIDQMHPHFQTRQWRNIYPTLFNRIKEQLGAVFDLELSVEQMEKLPQCGREQHRKFREAAQKAITLLDGKDVNGRMDRRRQKKRARPTLGSSSGSTGRQT